MSSVAERSRDPKPRIPNYAARQKFLAAGVAIAIAAGVGHGNPVKGTEKIAGTAAGLAFGGESQGEKAENKFLNGMKDSGIVPRVNGTVSLKGVNVRSTPEIDNGEKFGGDRTNIVASQVDLRVANPLFMELKTEQSNPNGIIGFLIMPGMDSEGNYHNKPNYIALTDKTLANMKLSVPKEPEWGEDTSLKLAGNAESVVGLDRDQFLFRVENANLGVQYTPEGLPNEDPNRPGPVGVDSFQTAFMVAGTYQVGSQ